MGQVCRVAMKFTARRIPFGLEPGHADDDGDQGDGIPTPALVRLQARRAAGIREAKQVLTQLPGPGESLHALVTARLDLTDVINALLEKLGRCDRLMVATLGYNQRNLRAMLSWLDFAQVGEL